MAAFVRNVALRTNNQVGKREDRKARNRNVNEFSRDTGFNVVANRENRRVAAIATKVWQTDSASKDDTF